MKLCLLVLLVTSYCQPVAFSQSYNDSIAIDLCNCMARYSDSLSKKANKILVKASEFDKYEDVEEVISDYFFSSSPQAEEDLKYLEKSMNFGLESCLKLVDSRYNEYLKNYSGTQEEFSSEIVLKMRKVSKCKIPIAVILLEFD